MAGADSILTRLAARTPVAEPVVLLVAHPDDEIIGAGATLPLFRQLILVHVTDGAPRNLADATAHGFADAASYAAARELELAQALRVAGVSPRRVQLGAADQGASTQMAALTHALRDVVARHGAAAVLTHPYEGGHPDHDAAAFIAAHAGRPVLEFASYHAAPDGGLAVGRFLPGGHAGGRIGLTPGEQARKRAMFACFTTQAATLAPFGTEWETLRTAPAYDFTQPPHPGTLHYERHDWGMTGARWRGLASEAARALC